MTIKSELYALPNAVTNKIGNFQIYQGDFFNIIVTRPASRTLHEQYAAPHPLPSNFTKIQFSLTHFIFELRFTHDTLVDYEALQEPETLQLLAQLYSRATEELINSFFDNRLSGALADRFLYAKVVSLLVHLAREAEARSNLSRLPDATVMLAERTRDRILADLSEFETVEQLARRAGTSKQILQSAFRQRFGTTVGDYSRSARLLHARQLLESTNETLLSIALSVGYSDPANFSTAFKTKFGFPPRKKMR